MEEWKEYKLGDICTKIGSGATPKGGKESYRGGDTSLIRSQNVLDFSFSWDGLAYINKEQALKLNGVEVKQGDVLLNITGDSVARVCIVPKSALPARVNQHVSIIRGNSNIVLNDYLLYFLQYKKLFLLSLSQGGATRNALTKGMIEELTISLPALSKQAEIVSILKSLDDKIEINRRINDNLEQQAQALFKSWFVDFEPFKDQPFEESELGMIPKGWRVGTYKEVCQSITDGVHNSVKDDLNGNYYLLSCKNIKGGVITIGENERRIDKTTFEKLRKRTKLQKGDILLSSVGTIGEMVLLNAEPTNYEFQRSVAILKPCPELISSHFLYYSMKSQRANLINAAHGAVQQCLFISDIANCKTIYPTHAEMQRFTDIVIETENKISQNQQESRRLAQLRDLLLPKLMSGEIKV